MDLSDDELTYEVIGGFRRVYNHYGFGLLESAYSAALVHVWRSKGLAVEREVPVSLYFEATNIGSAPEIKRFTLRNSLKGRTNNSMSQGKRQEGAGNSEIM